MTFDTLVLGGGMIGVSVAVHLQQRGQSVVLVDRKAPGNETSLGNAGLIQREGVYPYAFPRGFGTLLKYACNRSPDVRYHAGALPKLIPFLYRYWRNSHPARHAEIARAYAPLIEHCVTEHRALIEAAGAGELLREGGWLKVFRTAATRDAETRDAERWRAEYGVTFDALDAAALRDAEPHLSRALLGALRYTGSDSISDPNALVTAYARHFEQLGGRILTGDALTLSAANGWRVDTAQGPVDARAVVVALGPWSDLLCERLGYTLPLAVKRGYHMHYAPQPGARLHRPVLDADSGFLITPMTRGIRLTTGVELGYRDTPPTPTQLAAVEPVARELFPLGARVDGTPWLGRRPCTPDMLPVIGAAPRHRDLWFAFGHAHHGFTLGPVTGRLIADLMTGTQPFVDPAPFRVERFLHGR
ncbi:MAG: FAD-binding oxidoreductase [Burkholderia sp.]|jgi:D-amino-acid dehydrogenase|uniref:NAD(P)/FAD-dependent oxidoreductase n=1 Tax=Burkholderia TaxID=32008 RepID=UPI00158EF4BF|nr:MULTISPECIES: FAD-binding oxidoreductase [Burkholderia]MCA3780708.1 FAD-binding oxidoreductase [Burkholderia sp.]MCA3787858.1 FAD-binding oxidoreductase [Burkholderia sp.]MCA3791846.1 FAD-binding oxidoreductase [Burkholderia sp.]MCA3799867.1 FAD-binding oxidoreductase [Burkholderia sp.]MCA3808694.1 FAD-binding oxidoreductase [Burkholderia sp.]